MLQLRAIVASGLQAATETVEPALDVLLLRLEIRRLCFESRSLLRLQSTASRGRGDSP